MYQPAANTFAAGIFEYVKREEFNTDAFSELFSKNTLKARKKPEKTPNLH